MLILKIKHHPLLRRETFINNTVGTDSVGTEVFADDLNCILELREEFFAIIKDIFADLRGLVVSNVT